MQGTEIWKKERNSYIGASDASVCLGISPYKTMYALWEEKLGLGKPQEETEVMRYGKSKEEALCEVYAMLTGKIVWPTSSPVFHKTICYLACNLDGLTEDGKWAVEIKCNNKENHELAKEGELVDHHMSQCQHQLACLNHEKMDYLSYHQGDTVIVRVDRDEDYIKDMLKKEKEFWNYVQNLEEPPLVDRDFRERGALFLNRCKILWDIQEEIREKQKIIDEVKSELVALSEGVNSRAGEYRFQVSSRKGAVNYSSIPELNGVDLEKYRKAPIKTWSLKKE